MPPRNHWAFPGGRLCNELRILLVGVGAREAYLAIRSDDQLENRFEPIMPTGRWKTFFVAVIGLFSPD